MSSLENIYMKMSPTLEAADFANMHHESPHPDTDRQIGRDVAHELNNILTILRGYADRMALSHDCASWADYLPTNALRHQLLPDHRYHHVCRKVVPALLEGGVNQRDIDTMFIDNPRRHFEGSAARFAARG